MVVLMTPRKRARPCGAGLPVRAAGVTATPCRHVLMTANDSTPLPGHDSTELEDAGFPLWDASDEEFALAIEEQKNRLLAAVETVNEALVNDDVPLTEEKVERLWTVSGALVGLSRSAATRVPVDCDAGDE